MPHEFAHVGLGWVVGELGREQTWFVDRQHPPAFAMLLVPVLGSVLVPVSAPVLVSVSVPVLVPVGRARPGQM